MCGKNDRGQLGLGNMNQMYETPYYVNRVPNKVNEVACGDMHTLLLTLQGEIFSMGDNSRGQLGTGIASMTGNCLPTFLDNISATKMIKIRAGQFSAALSINDQLFVWGEGYFGK